MIRKSSVFSFILVLGFVLHLTNGFADEDGGFANDIFIPADGFVFPTPEGEGYIQDTLEYQRVPEVIIETADFEKMRDLPTDSQDYQLGRKVGVIGLQDRTDPNLFHLWCTGFLVGPDLFMANHHCTYDDNGLFLLTGAAIFMDYYQELSVDPSAGGLTARVSEVVHAQALKDYALLRLDKPIGDTYGWLELATTTDVNTNQSVKIIQHPQSRSKEIVRKNSQILGTLVDYPFALAYLADSEPGSSGSPVFLKDGTSVIAIHHSGWSDPVTGEPLFNAGSLMSYIVPEIQQWLPGGTPARPDLVVTAPQVDNGSLRLGESFTLSATVRNQGDAAAQATTLRFYRSTDTTITTADVTIGTAAVSSLAPSGAGEASLTLTAPTAVGTYYYGACVDAVDNEDATNNNCSTAVRVTVSTAPDLVVAAPQISKGTLHPGESFTLSATVRNQGDAAAQATTLRFYRSTDTTITTADVTIGTAAVSSLAPSGAGEASLTLTAPTAVGTYYYGACVDAVDNEGTTNNNCSIAVRITVSTAPDLVVAAPQVSKGSLRPGESFTLSATVRNQGDAAAQATTLRFYRSTDTTITTADVAIGTAVVGSLAPSDTSEASLTLTAPTAVGTYYYGACVDAIDNENVTNNNCSTAVRITVSTAPDLVVTAPQVDNGALLPGESFTLSATVRNQGDAAAQATTLRFYRSTDTTITAADVAIGTAVVGSLAPSDTSEASLTLTAPTAVGTYYYGACVDAVDNENVTNNNCSTAVRITVSTAPDLVVTAPQVDNGALLPGESFTLSVTVRNQGGAAASATTLRFYESLDNSITSLDIQLDTASVDSLAPDATTEVSVKVTAFALGTYYYGACIDEVANETNTDNNCSTGVSVTVSTTPPPPGAGIRFDPSTIDDQTFSAEIPIIPLQLPLASGGTPPYIYTLSPIPDGLNFDETTQLLSGIPTLLAVGTTSVTYTATDAIGDSAALYFTIEVLEDGMPAGDRVDVNGDGVVDVVDLVIVAMAYGTRVPVGTDLPADVNLDLVVNVLDIILVAQAIDAAGGGENSVSLADIAAALAAAAAALEDVAAAPNALSGVNLAYRNVAAALADARKLEKGIPETVLKELLHLLAEMKARPEASALLPNYPNPFNPETWIPYHLAKDAAVVLTIYDVRGSVVRTLKMGHQLAGVYQSKHRAAYWDGKNQIGEKVASGFYFYTLTAGDFIATRKMLIAK